MAGKGELLEDHGSGNAPTPIPPQMSTTAFPRSVDISSFTHTPFYCEENVYLLCKKLCMTGMADEKGADLFVVFISNEEKKVPLWCQQASKRTDGLVIWDYHVICIQSVKDEKGNANHQVWDLDSTLPCPLPLNQYIGEAIPPLLSYESTYNRLFRVVHAPNFLCYFASDRSHMKDSLGNWISIPPAYKAIVADDGTENNLNEYIRMCTADAIVDMDALTFGLYSNKFGVVISELMLRDLFSQIRIR